MKNFLLIIFVIGVSFSKAQCSFTTSVTNICCSGQCNGAITFSLSAGCSTYPYFVSLSNQSCIPGGTIILNTSVTTFSSLCACASSYTVVDNAATLISTGSFSILQAPPLTINTITNVAATCGTCCNGYINTNTNGGTSPYTYTWSATGGSVTNTANLTSACPGNYSLCVTDGCGCLTCKTYSVGFGTNISELQIEPIKLIYNEDKITLVNAGLINYVSVFDLTGQLIFKTERLEQNNFVLNKQSFNKGVYFVYLESDKQMWRQKIIID